MKNTLHAIALVAGSLLMAGASLAIFAAALVPPATAA